MIEKFKNSNKNDSELAIDLQYLLLLLDLALLAEFIMV